VIGLFSALLIAASVAGPAELDRLQAWADRWPTSDPVPEVSADYRLAGPLYAEIARLAVEKPGVVETEVIGTTLAQQPIFAFHVTEPAVPVERSVLVMAGIHALEWISTEVAVDLLTELIALPPRGTRVTVIPILNVDGRARVEADLFAGQNVYRRGNLVFADLNRDFEVQREARALWRHVIPGYYRTTDAEALSQPESRALDALLDRERYDRAASLHAFGG